ncbi:MAG TPA: class I SAM-dependent methyltransferase [Terriglobia bacterium]|nr:class I SAM-dependent methyltransferase [Terriglobia bacterium]
MSITARIMENTLAYRLWMAPFAEKKFAPILAHNDLSRVRRVLDVGCGPGTNTQHFAHVDYLGVDINSAYIEHARQRHHRNFLVADVRNYTVAPDERFDFILLNSFLHHIDTPHTLRILSHLQTLLTEDGCVHVIELVLPERPSIPRFLAQRDRGEFPRPLDEWRRIFGDVFETSVFEPFTLTGLRATLWEMIYFKGRAKR